MAAGRGDEVTPCDGAAASRCDVCGADHWTRVEGPFSDSDTPNSRLPALTLRPVLEQLHLAHLRETCLSADGFESDENGHARSPFYQLELNRDGERYAVSSLDEDDFRWCGSRHRDGVGAAVLRLVDALSSLRLACPDTFRCIYGFTSYDVSRADERGHTWHRDFYGQLISVRCGMVLPLNDAAGVWTGADFVLRNAADPSREWRIRHAENQGVAFNNEALEHRVTPWMPSGSGPGQRAVLIVWLYW